MATTGKRMNSKSGVAGDDKGRSFSRVSGRAEVGNTFQIGEEANDFGEIALSRSSIVETGHYDSGSYHRGCAAPGCDDGSGGIISLEFQLVTESTLDCSSKDGIDNEQEQMMVTSSGVCCLAASWRRIHVHGTESSCHYLKAVIREKFQLEEEDKSKEGHIRTVDKG